jgi:hypothetical protein
VDLTFGVNPPEYLRSTEYGGRERKAQQHE